MRAKLWSRFRHLPRALFSSIWLFPAIIVTLFIIAVAFGINGSSVGMYQKLINPSSTDLNLVFGTPRDIRSDEWWVGTPLLKAQAQNGFPSSNPNVGDGQNIDVLSDVPAYNWSQIFRPQNWAFYVLPFDNAFSFRWWAMPVLLLLSAYIFALGMLGRDKRLLSSLLSLSLFLSPFLHWWSPGQTMGIVAFSLLIMSLVTWLFRIVTVPRKITISLFIIYCAVCFSLYVYPPFQIPCLLIIIAYTVGLLLRDGTKSFLAIARQNSIYILSALVISAGIFGAFMIVNKDTIDVVQNTAYPGRRIVNSGGYSVTHLLSGHLSYKLSDDSVAGFYRDADAGAVNQSEASTFIFISFFTTPALVYAAYRFKQREEIRKLRSTIIALGVVTVLMVMWLFVPGLGIVGALTKLNLVPLNRLVIGLGLLNFIWLVLFAKIFISKKISLSRFIGVTLSVATVLVMLYVNIAIAQRNPGFLGTKQIVASALIIPFIVYLLLRKRLIAGLAILVLFSGFCVIHINPLYRGLGALTQNPLYSAVNSVQSSGRWLMDSPPILNSVLLAANAKLLTGTYLYPQPSLWQDIGGVNSQIYNRYARVSADIDKNRAVIIPTSLSLTNPDSFLIKTELCSDFMRTERVSQVVSQTQFNPAEYNCIVAQKDVVLDHATGTTLYIYTVDNN